MIAKSFDWWKTARLMLLSRALDRLEVERLTPQGKVKYQFSASGHELPQILVAQAMDHPHDAATVYYRSRPFLLASGLSPEEALAGGLALQSSPTQGRDVGVMFNLPPRSSPTVLPASGDVGAQYTPAAGWAQAILYRQKVLVEQDWNRAIAVAFGGEGSTAANGFWAALNIVTTQRLPMVFLIENNCYGLSVPAEMQTPGGNITANLASFSNLKILEGDGTDPEQASSLVQAAVEHVRSGEGPCLLQLFVVRLTGHTFIDDQSYKSDKERTEEERRDPIVRLREYLNDDLKWQTLEAEVTREIDDALAKAEKQPEPDASGVARHLFFEGQSSLQGGLRAESAAVPLGSSKVESRGARINFIDAVRMTLEFEMHQNKRMLVFGEDVGVKGGVHGATQDMIAHFGPDRIFDTSLNEDGIIGRAVGMAIAGLLPVPEIQFRKYADPAHEQISDIGTIRWRTANRFSAPVVIRIPVGFGKKTGDPWHSVSAEAVFAHLPGWRIAYPSNAEDAVGLLRTALRSDDPTLFLEHRALLDTREGRRPYPGNDYCLPFGKAARLASGDSLTLVSWGAMVHRCLEAINSLSGQVDFLDLRTIIPWDEELVLESVRHTGKVLIVHEDTLTNAFSGEIIAAIASKAFDSLDAPIERMGVADIPIPYNIHLMEAVIPSTTAIRAKIEQMLTF